MILYYNTYESMYFNINKLISMGQPVFERLLEGIGFRGKLNIEPAICPAETLL